MSVCGKNDFVVKMAKMDANRDSGCPKIVEAVINCLGAPLGEPRNHYPVPYR